VELVLLQVLTDHPAKVEFGPGDSVSVTWLAGVKFALQITPQLIPAGLLVIVPVPVPARLTDNVGPLKVAVTCWLAISVNVQVLLVPQLCPAPVQPAKVEGATGVAVSVT
jgi:hypothetical protein